MLLEKAISLYLKEETDPPTSQKWEKRFRFCFQERYIVNP